MTPLNLQRVMAWLVAVAVLCPMSSALAGDYDEAINGDLSGTPASPTAWTLDLGANVLTAAAGPDDNDVNDYDLVSFTVPAGAKLDSITITAFAFPNGGRQNFFGLQAGSPWLDQLGMDVVGTYLMGYELVATSEVGTDLLAKMVDVNNPNSFQPPLQAGVYTLLAQDTATFFTYTLTFNVSSIPEPTGACIAGCAFGALGLVRSRRRAC